MTGFVDYEIRRRMAGGRADGPLVEDESRILISGRKGSRALPARPGALKDNVRDSS